MNKLSDDSQKIIKRLKELAKLIKLHNEHYHQNDKPIISDGELDKLLKENLDLNDFCAIGEIGIDLYWDKTNLLNQQDAFNQQILWAKEYDLPIVIHCRDAFDEVFEVLDQQKSPELYGIFHCFTGDLIQAKRAIDLNFKLGIGGVITYKNGKIDKFLNELPLKSIVLETDSPYLSPKPYRGKRNESSYLTLILNKVAECYQIPVNELAAITTQNACLLYTSPSPRDS